MRRSRPRPLEPPADLRSPEAFQCQQLVATSLVQRGASSPGAPCRGVVTGPAATGVVAMINSSGWEWGMGVAYLQTDVVAFVGSAKVSFLLWN